MGQEYQTSTIKPDIEIHIENIDGDLEVKGSAETLISAKGDKPRLYIDKDGQTANLSCSGDCVLRVPVGASIRVESIGGDGKFLNVEGDVRITSVGGDLTLKNVGTVEVESVGADLEVRHANGSIRANSVGADADIKGVDGDVEIVNVGSTAAIKNIEGSCQIDSIGSELVLAVDFEAGREYKFGNIGSEAIFTVYEDSSVRIILPNEAERDLRVRDVRVERHDDELDAIVLADGAAEVTIESIGSEFQLIGKDREDFDDVIDTVVPENLDEIISSHMDSARGQLSRETERIQREAMRAAERAREKAEQMAERARREAERIQRNAERAAERAKNKRGRGRGWNFEFSWPGRDAIPPMPPTPPNAPLPPMPPMPFVGRPPSGPTAEPVSDEERLMILRMVESKQISVEEAERLLKALEGRE